MDLAVLQGALDDVVGRHELLRTLVVRDADPPYQIVRPPCRVPLKVRDVPPDTEWQRANASSSAEDGAPKYWQEKLHGAREFTISNDHGHPESYSRPYSLHVHVIDADVIAQASALATATRSTSFTVLLSAFYVLAYKITGVTDLAIRAFTAGRDEPQFQDTMGLFLNVVPFRTHLDGCTSFRDIVTRAMETFIDAVTHELPANVIEQAFPDFIKSREDLRTSQFIISSSVSLFDDDLTHPIAEGAREISERLLQEPVHHDIPSGMVWNLSVEPAGKLNGSVLFNQDEFDESTVQGWAADLRHILTSAVRHPDQDWKTL